MNKLICELYKQRGVILNKNEAELRRFKDSLPEGAEAVAEFYLVGEDKTYPQVKKVHALFREVSQVTGEFAEDVKKRYKKKMGLCFTTKIGSVEKEHCLSIRDMDLIELSEFIAQCEAYASEEGVFI